MSIGQIATLTVDEFEKGIMKDNIQILDVRTAKEYRTGHLRHALQANWEEKDEFKKRVESLDKSKPIYIYCLSGIRSKMAMVWLSKNGFKDVYELKGGINAWKQLDKPIEGSSYVKQMNLSEVLKKVPTDKIVLVDIGAEWCPPCKKMKPIIEELKNENYSIINVDGGEQSELCKELKITAFPVFIYFKNEIEILRKRGIQSKEELINGFNEAAK